MVQSRLNTTELMSAVFQRGRQNGALSKVDVFFIDDVVCLDGENLYYQARGYVVEYFVNKQMT